MSIRVLIADDHEVVRSGLKSLFTGHEIEVVAEAPSGSEAVRLAKEIAPDVVMLDVRMTDGDGLSALSQIRQHKADLPVVILSTYDNPTYVARALALGANGYLLKGSPAADIISAVERVAKGESLWTREEMRRASGVSQPAPGQPDVEIALTKRESEVLRQIALGLTNKEIAQSLHISYETVKEHVQHVLRKIGVSDRTQAAVWAVRRGLV